MSEGVAGQRNGELLERYLQHWGLPADFVLDVTREGSRRFRILVFDGQPPVARLVTCGLGTCQADDGALLHMELLMTLGTRELAEIGSPRVTGFLADIAAHLLRHSVRPVEGSVIARTSLAPWEADAIVFDVPRGERPDLECFEADGHTLRLVWAVPAYAAEAELVASQGIEALDRLVESSDFSLGDVRRPPLR